LPSPLAVSKIRLISRFSAAVSFTAGFAACRACGSGFRFLNNGFHLLFRLGLPLQGCVEIVCLVRPLLRPQEHTADDLSGHHLQGLAVPLIHGEQKEREHDDNHAERGGAVAGRASEQKEKRYSDECRRSETYKLPFGKPKQHFGFYFRQILWNGYIRQFIKPP